ncbi:MAG TPA: hypothetical protein VN461_10455 [Vicinamibacteria bacterium]|jgi:hypothetical protein|nr:hypothetical protein [Vicinamibacteria bacterium]
MAESTAEPRRLCRACAGEVTSPTDLGWECECGVVVCTDPACYEEYFKGVGGGEGVRCRTCGLVT